MRKELLLKPRRGFGLPCRLDAIRIGSLDKPADLRSRRVELCLTSPHTAGNAFGLTQCEPVDVSDVPSLAKYETNPADRVRIRGCQQRP